MSEGQTFGSFPELKKYKNMYVQYIFINYKKKNTNSIYVILINIQNIFSRPLMFFPLFSMNIKDSTSECSNNTFKLCKKCHFIHTKN